MGLEIIPPEAQDVGLGACARQSGAETLTVITSCHESGARRQGVICSVQAGYVLL